MEHAKRGRSWLVFMSSIFQSSCPSQASCPSLNLTRILLVQSKSCQHQLGFRSRGLLEYIKTCLTVINKQLTTLRPNFLSDDINRLYVIIMSMHTWSLVAYLHLNAIGISFVQISNLYIDLDPGVMQTKFLRIVHRFNESVWTWLIQQWPKIFSSASCPYVWTTIPFDK